jgi:hypothetical protein
LKEHCLKCEITKRVARRKFLAGLGAAAAVTAAASLPSHAFMTPTPLLGPRDSRLGDQQVTGQAQSLNSPFRIAIINDEISQDFGRACEVAAREFGMHWIELRGMWNKNILRLDSNEVAEARRIVEKYGLRVTDIAGPLFKVDWKGAPQSKFSQHGDFHADFSFEQQDEVLERATIRFYVDHQFYITRTRSDLRPDWKWVFDHPFFLLLNVAVGGDWPGNPDSTTVFPRTMLVDYVRMYQRTGK